MIMNYKKYIVPNIYNVTVDNCSILASSYVLNTQHICDNYCTFWHFCKDRHKGYYCEDRISK